MSKASKRLTLLDISDYHAFYDLPQFNEAEQQYYFTLTPEAQKHIEKLSLASQCYFILQWGYVRARLRFFTLTAKGVKCDIAFILSVYFPADTNSSIEILPSRNTQTALKRAIIKLLKINGNEKSRDQFLEKKAANLLVYYHRPQDIFRALISMIEKENFFLPDYTIMQNIISTAITQEESRLSSIIAKQLQEHIRAKLSNIIRETEKFYLLMNFKQDLKNFNYQQMKNELEKQQLGKDIYDYSKTFLPTLEISQHNIHHYGKPPIIPH